MSEHAHIAPQTQPTPAAASREAVSVETLTQETYGFQRLPIQRKLTVGAVDDPLEAEADAMADRVMRMAEPSFIQRKCAHCEEKEQVQRKPLASFIQRKADVGGGMASEAITNRIRATQGAGTPMPTSTRSFMESRFGTDFSSVNIHTGSDAVQLSRELNAQAFTVGNDIYFNSGKFAPDSSEGKQLLAHELTHTVQQNGSVNRMIQRIVDQVEINCADNQVRFNHDGQTTGYALDHCNVTDGTYNATVALSRGRVEFTLGTVAPGTNFDFHYNIGPGQPSPNTFFRGQHTVPIICTHTSSTTPQGFDVIFESYPLGPVLGALGSTSRLVAMGDLGWLTAGGSMRWGTMMGPTTWRPMWNMFPGSDSMLLDRLIDIGDGSTPATSDLTLALEPRLQSQLRTGGPFSWARRGFTPAELASIEELVRRLNTQGIASLSDVELALLRQAVQLHFDGAMAGSPFASYTPLADTAPFLESLPSAGDVRYRVRVRVNASSVLDGITPSEFNAPDPGMLSNPGEFDMLVTTNAEGELLSVQRVTTGAEPPGWLMRNQGTVRWGGRLLMVAGAGLSVYRIATASDAERPRVVVQEGGSWGGGFLGAELGTGACIAFGIATEGVGLLLCGLVGGVGGGYLGSQAATGAYDAAPGVIDQVTQPLQEGYNWLDRGVRDLYGIGSGIPHF